MIRYDDTGPRRRQPRCLSEAPSVCKTKVIARPRALGLDRLRAWTSSPLAVHCCPDVPETSHQPDAMNSATLGLLASARVDFTSLRETLSDVRAACAALPQVEQQRYRDALQSVVDARRSAETHEGPLQVC
jgi:hypothetical protein